MKNIQIQLSVFLLIVGSSFFSGCAAKHHYAEPGQQVRAHFDCYLDNGELVDTSHAGIAGDPDVKKSIIFKPRDIYRPVRFEVSEEPEKLKTPPYAKLNEKIGYAIARKIKDIPMDTTSRQELEDEEIIDFPPKDRYLQMATKYPVPREREMPMDEFALYYGKETKPAVGATVDADGRNPGIVKAVGEETVTVYFSAPKDKHILVPTGYATVEEHSEKEFMVHMDVHEGQLYQQLGGLPGRVSMVNEDMYKIDFGHSFAGENLLCDITTESYSPDTEQLQPQISWLEDYDQAMAMAKDLNKPVVLVLYADWCKYCHKYFKEILPDPNIHSYYDKFIWLKINSDKLSEFADKYEQKSYPMTVFIEPDGSEFEKSTGLPHITALVHSLHELSSENPKS